MNNSFHSYHFGGLHYHSEKLKKEKHFQICELIDSTLHLERGNWYDGKEI